MALHNTSIDHMA